jgi:anti-anti-sigma factor
MTVETLGEARVDGEPEFGVSLRHVGAVCVLAMRGSLGVATVAALEATFDRLWRTPCRRVVLDVNALTGVDDTGVRVLTGLHHYLRARGGRLSVVGANPWVAAALSSTPLLQPSEATAG